PSVPFPEPSPFVTVQAIGTASNGETTYAVDEIQSVYVDVGIYTTPVTSDGIVFSATVTVPSTYTTDPVTVSGIIVEDATHKVVDLTYPTAFAFEDVLHDHEDCTFDANGGGSCVGLIEQLVADSVTTTFTLTATGTLSPFYTITAATDAVLTSDTAANSATNAKPTSSVTITNTVPVSTTSTTSATPNAARPGRRFASESCIGWSLFAVGTFSAWVLLL
ncbi:hypothetical protein H0H93_014257, partial [Arthromyces matolae]